MDVNTASGLLKYEMSKFDSLIVKAAYVAKVPAGGALAVDRLVFSKVIMDSLNSFEDFELLMKKLLIPDEKTLEETNDSMIVASYLNDRRFNRLFK